MLSFGFNCFYLHLLTNPTIMNLRNFKLNFPLIYLFLSCSLLIGSCTLLLLLFFVNYVFYAVLILSILAFCGVFVIRLRTAQPNAVDAILGSLWGASKYNNDPSLKPLKIIAHRACGLDAPENSISALKKIIKEGITAVEFDIMLTSDKVPVVFHDDTLFRVANVTEAIEDLTFKELEKIDISTTHPFRKNYEGEKVPSFNSFVKCCVENNVTMIIDIKNASMAPAVIEAFKNSPRLTEMALVSSFDPLVIYKIRRALPQVVGCLAWRPYYYSYEEYSGIEGPMRARSNNPIVYRYLRIKDCIYSYLLNNFIYSVLGLSALLLHKDIISRDVIQFWKNRGIRVLAWTVNNPVEKDFFERFLQIPYLTDTVIAS